MGTSDLRDAFNSVSQPAGITCTMALLDYERKHDTEFQILRFCGTDASGEKFDIKSDDIRPSGDVNQMARETAQRLLDQRKPAT